MQGKISLSARQIKAARALLDWSQDDLAAASNLSVATIRKIESGHISPRGKTNDDIKRAFENADLEFIEPGGVRHRPDDIKIYQGAEGARAFFDDVYKTAKDRGGDYISVCPSDNRHFTKLLGDYREIHITRMAAIKASAHVKCILTEDRHSVPATSYCEYRWIPTSYINSVPFYVYDDKYAILADEIEASAKITVIRSRIVAAAFRQQFYSMWDKATPLNMVDRNDAPAKAKK